MSRTEELNAIAYAKLQAILPAYIDEAPDGAAYPYCVFSFDDFTFEDARDDIILEIDVWDSYENYKFVESYADQIEAALVGGAVYSSDSSVLPQFFRYLRSKVPDTDPKIKRINLKFEVQNYNL